jgi:undecaprenyl phosphate-alpha-L-ara4N flippase subunit ArnE
MTALLSLLLLFVYAAASVSGLVLLKLESNVFSVRFLLGAFLYGVGFLIWYALLRLLPLSLAFPLAAGCLIVGTQLAGRLILRESIGSMQLIGIFFIFVGIVILSTRELVGE